MSPEIAIEFECEREEAERRVDVEGNGRVTDGGNYLREESVSVPVYQHIRNKAESDEEASIKRVSL